MLQLFSLLSSLLLTFSLITTILGSRSSSSSANQETTFSAEASIWRLNARRIICTKHKSVFSWDASDVDFFVTNINIGSVCSSSLLQQLHQPHYLKSCANNNTCQASSEIDSATDKVEASLKKLILLKNTKLYPVSCKETDTLHLQIAIEQIYNLSDFNNDGILNIDEFSSDYNEDGELSYNEFLQDKMFDNLFKFSSLSLGCGAEDMDLNHLRKANPQVFLTFLISTILSPHLALLFDRSQGGILDKIVFGSDEALAKSPFSWLTFPFFPGFTIARYFFIFTDTNIVQSCFLIVISIIPDMLFWSEAALFFLYHTNFKQQIYALVFFFSRNLIGFCVAFVYYIVIPYLIYLDYYFSKLFDFDIFDGAPRNWILLFGLNYDLLLMLFIYLTYKYFRFSKNFLNSLSARRTFSQVVDDSKQKQLINLIRNLRHDLISKEKVDSLYYIDRRFSLGAGGAGTVTPGHLLSDPSVKVAIKELSFTITPEDKETNLTKGGVAIDKSSAAKNKLSEQIWKMINGSFTSSISDSLIDRIIDKSILKENLQKEKLRHEVLVLKVIKNFRYPDVWHPSLQEIMSAHINGNNFIIVSKRVRPIIKEGKLNDKIQIFDPKNEESKLHSKLSVIQTFFSAIAALHEAGIVHRDINPNNLGVSMSDNECAVVIDFGISFIPRSTNEKEIQSVGSDDFLSPEYFSAMQTTKQKHGILDSIAQNYKGPPLDCFASAVTAIELLTNLSYTNDYIPKKLLELYNLHEYGLYSSRYLEVKRAGLLREMPKWSDQNIDEVIQYLPAYVPTEIKSLFRGMLHPDRDKRTTMMEAANWDYFAKHNIGEFKYKGHLNEDPAFFKYFISTFIGKEKREKIMKERETAVLSIQHIASAGGIGSPHGTAPLVSSTPPASPIPPLHLIPPSRSRSISTSSSSEVLVGSVSQREESPILSYSPGGDAVMDSNKIGFVALTRMKLLQEVVLKSRQDSHLATAATATAAFIEGNKRVMKLSRDEGQKLIEKIFESFEKVCISKGNRNIELSQADFELVFKGCNLDKLIFVEAGVLFQFLDIDNSHGVSRCELLTGICFLLSQIVDEETLFKLLFHAYDFNGDKRLSYYELALMISHFYVSSESEQSFLRSSDEHDDDGDISCFHSMVTDDCTSIKVKSLDKIFHKFDINGDGAIDVDEFIDGLKNKPELASLAKTLLRNSAS